VARIPRRLLVGKGTVNHCTWRSHNFSPCLGTPEAKDKFLELLAEHMLEHGMEILSYTVMDTHPHVQSRSVKGQKAFSRFWQIVNYRFARWHNRVNRRRGQVVMDRLRSGQVTDGSHQLAVMRYGDMNPVRAGLVSSPKKWRWSSYRHYAFGEKNPLITDAPEYLALGATGAARRKAYVHLFAQKLSNALRTRRVDLVSAPFIGPRPPVPKELTPRATSPPG
jgi:putative transposase